MADDETAQIFPVPKAMANAHISSREQYDAMYKESITEPEKFWCKIADTLSWHKKYDKVLDYNFALSKGSVFVKWFESGELNMCYNCVDRHVEAGRGDHTAFLWEGNDPTMSKTMTYAELQKEVCRFANVLKSQGVKKGDRVAFYLPMILELPIGMLACARIGAVHSVVFGGFSSKSLADRIKDSGAKVLVTADGVYRGTKLIQLKAIVDVAMEECKENGTPITSCIVVKWQGGDKVKGVWSEQYHWYGDLRKNATEECEPVWMGAEEPLFMLYTSGSTGTPKGLLHSTAGYAVHALSTFTNVFDYKPDDVYWCTADCGWITGHTYVVYGPLLAGAVSLVFEGIPTYPDVGRFWQVCEKYKVNQFYTSPTAIRALLRSGNAEVDKCDLSSLRVLGTVGEPINPEAWLWYYHVVGRGKCAVVDTYWQTETGGHIITPLPGAIPTTPGSCCTPYFGINAALLDTEGNEVIGEGEGFLVIKSPWPGAARTVYGNHSRFEATYYSQFDGFYCTGDGAKRDQNGYYWITGRVDDVMCVSGHRIGTAEVEAALASHDAVSEAAAIQVPHDIKGHAIHAFVILRPDYSFTPELESELKLLVRNQVGAFAAPDSIRAAVGLPKTRSGKIMRRVLRKIACNEFELGDTSTLAEPSVVEMLIKDVQRAPFA